MRALMTATVPSMIGQFNMENIKLLKEIGYEVDVACNFHDNTVWSQEKITLLKNNLESLNVKCYQIDFERNGFKFFKHIQSYKQIKDLMNNRHYKLIHTHTPISSLITRLAFKRSVIYNSCKMIYTAHGFHFFKGNSPIKNFVFKSIEKYSAKYTDVLITINKEDYSAAKEFKLKAGGKVEYIPGIGIDIGKINSITGNKEKLCKELHIPKYSILILSVGELSKRKNHELIIKSIPYLPDTCHYIICGQGYLKDSLIKLVHKLNVSDRVHFMGYRSDIIYIMKSCDIFIFPSLQEGLPVALMEAMASGLICISSNIRGNVDLIVNGHNGYLFKNSNEVIETIYRSFQLINKKKNRLPLKYSKEEIQKRLKKIYS